MDKVIDGVVNWNADRGLLDKGFDIQLEMGMILEEVLEGFGYPREVAKEKSLKMAKKLNAKSPMHNAVSLTDTIDAFGDIIFIAIGSLAKLGANPEAVLSDILKANQQKGNKVDKNGKIIKDDNFVEPNHSEVFGCVNREVAENNTNDNNEVFMKGLKDDMKKLTDMINCEHDMVLAQINREKRDNENFIPECVKSIFEDLGYKVKSIKHKYNGTSDDLKIRIIENNKDTICNYL